MLVSIVIPVFRNAGSLKELHERIVATVTKVEGARYEVVYTDDGSDDRSLEVLKEIHASDPNVIVVSLSRNFSQHAANQAGFRQVSGAVVVNMSADLQDPPEIIGSLLEKIRSGADIVLATRAKVDETGFKMFTSWLHYRLIRISVPHFPTGGFDFWAVNRKAFDAFMSFNDINRRNQIDLLSIGFRVVEVPYEKVKRRHGESQYGFCKRLDISLSQIFSTATWPMRIASLIGIFFTLVGFLLAVFFIVSYWLQAAPYPGWTSIIVLMLIIGGINSFTLGLVGEYIWRIYYEAKQRPLFFIDDILGKRSGDDNDRLPKKERIPG